MMADWEADRIRRKADFEKRMAEWEADFKMMAKMNADQEESKAGMMACLEKTEVRIETDLAEVEATDLEANPVETEAIVERQGIPHEEAAVHSMKAWQKGTVACQEMTEARLGCKEPTSEDMEPETEHVEKMDAWITELKDEQKETMVCQVTTEACLDSKEPNLEEMKSEGERREVPTGEVTVKSWGTMKKRHRSRHLAAGRR
jgi:hypothetical protein